ncbi:AAA family ATPase [Tabrizicola sp. BL-A-41-H6]|uniref:AAA family ATPase n=1 Tax=Tabrizicola sp. BL-A-41-H6 TaxID=3421107 RepID=UPI003D66975B
MKLISIELSDIRRFIQPVRIDGIGPGLNVLCAPNEFGKSTLFDALQALFFQPHRSKSKEIMALRPHVGGSPCITLEVDLPEGRHMLTKRWLGKPQATVHRGATLIAQADEAEAFISKLVQSGGEGGPSGLLWVRQGLTRLEGDGDSAKDREAAKTARRNLMTSVAGEVEALTGGRRMDRAIARTRDDLAKYLSPTGKAAKDKPLSQAEIAVEELTLKKASLEATAGRLIAALAKRREVIKSLADLTARDAVEARQQRLDEATRRFEEAKRHADALASSAAHLRSAELAQKTLAERLSALHRAQADQARAALALAAAQTAAGVAKAAAETADAAFSPCAAALTAARIAKGDADALLSEAHRAEATKAAAVRRTELAGRLEQAKTLSAQRVPLAKAAASGPEAKDIAPLQSLAQEADVQRALRNRSAPRVTFHHSGAMRVTSEGKPVPDTPMAILSDTRFDMPGLGHFTLAPGAGKDSSALDTAEAALSAALSRLAVPDLATAQAQAAARAEAISALRHLDTALKSLAPQGLAALEAELDALPEDLAPRAGVPTVAEAQLAAGTATSVLNDAQAAHDLARAEAERLRQAEVRATVKAEGLAAALVQTDATLATFGTDPELTILPELAKASDALIAARSGHASLAEAAPDRSAAEATLARARSVVESATAEIQRLQNERASLDTEINIHSGEGVMEELADITARLLAAEETLSHIRFEVAVLQELATALATARDEARDRYFEPVLTELRPLLRLLWPGAELRFDGETLLPTALVRDGLEEPLSILSGGTQEQIALLVRLAFARLLAARGHHAPIIFDDALVYTDDDRIEKMFDALHAQAADQQIIVLSCRQRAFRDLGGAALTMTKPASLLDT